MPESPAHFDAIVIGSGFAGAVTACRLVQAGFHVCILERGRRYDRWDFPVYPTPEPAGPQDGNGPAQGRDRIQPDFSRLFWKMGHGLWDVRDLGDVVVAQAAGYGGGSLIYANVHLRAPEDVFDARWPSPYRRRSLDPYYDLVAFMLGVEPAPEALPKTTQLARAAQKLGRGNRFFRPPLAVNFHPLGDEKKEFWWNRFDREQGACDMGGDCCFGCPRMAKNTLDRNYLAIAEDKGKPLADVRTLAEVVSVERQGDDETPRWLVEYRDHLGGTSRKIRQVTAPAVFLCAGAVNTTELLMRCRAAGKLGKDAARPGEGYHPNADAVAMVFDCDELHEVDRGPTITSSLLHQRDSDWLLVQEGGMPAALEPLLGLFRSPLWMGRNRYRENGAGPSSTTQQIGYGKLPFEVLTEAFSGMTRSAIRPGLPLSHEVGESLLSLARGEHWSYREELSGWSLLPDQMVEALEEIRAQLLEQVGVAAEPMVMSFLDKAAKKAERRFPMEELLKNLPPAQHLDLTGLGQAQLTRRILRLGLQLVWGSEGDLVRDIARTLMDGSLPQPEVLLQRISGFLRWALDYRLGDGRTTLLLSMGRDSNPGKLRLELPGPFVGDVIRDESSQASGVLVHSSVEPEGWLRDDAAGELVIAKTQGAFRAGELLVCNARVLGVLTGDEIALSPDGLRPARGKGPEPARQALRNAAASLFLLRFEPAPQPAPQPAQRPSVCGDPWRDSYPQEEGVDPDPHLRGVARAALRAELPDVLAAPERATQERLLRDIAARGWKGELRTDPLTSFMGRRLTVHSLGGCGMGASSGQGVTDATGQVVGCPGLYVMDAAAFPNSVGVNPSATIAAIAEYKVQQFIRTHSEEKNWQAKEWQQAQAWAEPRRAELDPMHGMSTSSLGPSAAPTAPPIGIKFSERMTGYHHPIGDANEQSYVQTWLHAKIDDLALFLEHNRRASPQEIPVTGSVVLRDAPGVGSKLHVHPGSHMQLFVKAGFHDGTSETREIVYRLVMGEKPFGETSPRDPTWTLVGRKIIRDDERFDLWEDTTTLFFDLFERDATQPFRSGVLRLPADAFFGEQVPSFEATGTDDPARRSWALAAFGHFFLGHLVDVYVPEFGRVRDVLQSVVERTHV